MDQQETLDFRALRAKFMLEGDSLHGLRSKPAIPEKPKVLPPTSPTSPTSPSKLTPFLSSINKAVESKTPFVPRVVFKDDKRTGADKQPLFLPTFDPREDKDRPREDKGRPREGSVKLNLLNEKQKKEGDLIKQAMNERKLPLLLPVTSQEDPMLPTVNNSEQLKSFLPCKTMKETLEKPETPPTSAQAPPTKDPLPLVPPPSLGANRASIAPPALPITAPPAVVKIPESRAPAFLSQPIAINPPSANSGAINAPSPSPWAGNPAVSYPEASYLGPVAVAPIFSAPGSISNHDHSLIPMTFDPSSKPPRVADADEGFLGNQVTAPFSLRHASPEKPTSAPSPNQENTLSDRPISPENLLYACTDSPERPSSALSALERAEKSPGKRTPPFDHRILNALEKSKNNRRVLSPSSSPITALHPLEATPRKEEPIPMVPNVSPIDYTTEMRQAWTSPAQISSQPTAFINGLDHSHVMPSPERTGAKGSEVKKTSPRGLPPPPPPRRQLESSQPPSRDSLLVQAPTPQDQVFQIPPPQGFAADDLTPDLPDFNDLDSEDLEFQVPDLENSKSPENETSGMVDVDHRRSEVQDRPEPVLLNENSPVLRHEALHSSEPPKAGTSAAGVPGEEPGSSISQGIPSSGVLPEDPNDSEGVYEDVTTGKKVKGLGAKKRKRTPKNPYGDTQQGGNGPQKSGWFTVRSAKKQTPLQNDDASKNGRTDPPDDKEMKKKEKQKERKDKESKEKDKKAQKEQKEREKKENEMKKKFKLTGQEEVLYQARVATASKSQKNDLPIAKGDIISIIRTSNCPRGKWLARDSANRYGYIPLNNVELDIKEMLELGKKASQAASRNHSNSKVDAEVVSTGSRASNHYSFTDDSEEWTPDDDEVLFSPKDRRQTTSLPDPGNSKPGTHPYPLNDATRKASPGQLTHPHPALEKLSTFFLPSTSGSPVVTRNKEQNPGLAKEESTNHMATVKDLEIPDVPILPPPDLFADAHTGNFTHNHKLH